MNSQNPVEQEQKESGIKIPISHNFALFLIGLIVLGTVAYISYTFLNLLPDAEVDSKDEKVCIQVVTSARNPQTGEEKTFGTPCEVPAGWKVVLGDVVGDVSTWKTYRNEEYGFELKIPNGFIVKELDSDEFVTKILSFEATTTDKKWNVVNGNTATVFQIKVYTQKQYNNQRDWCNNMLRESSEPSSCLRLKSIIEQSSEYVFVYENPAGPGFWMTPRDFDITELRISERSYKNFKLTK